MLAQLVMLKMIENNVGMILPRDPYVSVGRRQHNDHYRVSSSPSQSFLKRGSICLERYVSSAPRFLEGISPPLHRLES